MTSELEKMAEAYEYKLAIERESDDLASGGYRAYKEGAKAVLEFARKNASCAGGDSWWIFIKDLEKFVEGEK